MLKFFLFLFLIPLSYAFGESDYSQIELAYDEYKPGSSYKIVFHDLSNLDFQVLEVKKFFIPKWINQPGDLSDILQIKFNATNNGLSNFVVYKDMFQIDVIDPRENYLEVGRTNQHYVVDNYYPQYIEDFKLRFQDVALPQSLFECDLLNHYLRINQTKTLSVCFDVKQKWTNLPLDLNGPRLYYLVMMDNKFESSCSNCKSVLLNEYYKNPITESKISDDKISQNLLIWLDTLVIWLENSEISDQEFSNAIEFLTKRGIFERNPSEIKEIFLEPKIKNQSILAMADFKTTSFNEGQPIVFEGKITDYSGNPIPHVPILIRSDGPCPANQIIAQGITDKHGRYKILTKALLWDEHDGLITTFAEFPGSESFEQSVSDPQLVVVYSIKGEKCIE
ncbi:MAG TPA: hypothetical protein VMW74_08680 [Nitrosopumilaceae archaeon]|nr:hypothetical protein [Nitrosopumilaceae archaeon]